MLIDSHAHIYDAMFESHGGTQSIIDSMSADGLEYIICVGCDMPTSYACVELAEQNARVYATVGVHPYDADTVTAENIEKLRTLAAHKKVVAIGEIGLDYHRPDSDRETQLRATEMQYELARELKLPTVYHIRDGFGDFCEFARDREFPQGAVLHCFSGSAELAELFVKKGFYISFSGTVTYRNATKLARAAEVVPLDRLLIETDSPYLTPAQKSGEINFPKNVAFVCDKLAKIKGVEPAVIAAATTENAKRIFNIA